MESWLRLANLQLPPRVANTLLERFEHPDQLFKAPMSEVAGAAGLTPGQADRLADPSYLPTKAQLDYLCAGRAQLITLQDIEYPPRLRDIPDPPPLLFLRGRLNEKDRFSVSVVGSRQASPYGRTVTAKLARDLAAAGLTVVSGGAIGIDTAAHRAAVEAGGRTIVVLGCGLDVRYPQENQPLFEQIVSEERGALLTEFAPGSTPEPWRFPMRNRIISGLSMGVVIVEAGEQSGALLTAGMAAEQGREVMAVPGNIDRPGSRGANALIKDGAALVSTAKDILQTLGILVLEEPEARPSAAMANLPAGQQRLLQHLTLTPRHIDALATDLDMPPVQVSVEMTLLELAGLARRLPGNSYIRVL